IDRLVFGDLLCLLGGRLVHRAPLAIERGIQILLFELPNLTDQFGREIARRDLLLLDGGDERASPGGAGRKGGQRIALLLLRQLRVDRQDGLRSSRLIVLWQRAKSGTAHRRLLEQRPQDWAELRILGGEQGLESGGAGRV